MLGLSSKQILGICKGYYEAYIKQHKQHIQEQQLKQQKQVTHTHKKSNSTGMIKTQKVTTKNKK